LQIGQDYFAKLCILVEISADRLLLNRHGRAKKRRVKYEAAVEGGQRKKRVACQLCPMAGNPPVLICFGFNQKAGLLGPIPLVDCAIPSPPDDVGKGQREASEADTGRKRSK
jgi:hypothetical protein